MLGSLKISFTKRIQKLKQTGERIQIERYALHVLKCPSETQNAIYYVLNNEAIHSSNQTKLGYAGKFSEANSYLLNRHLLHIRQDLSR